jgi:hypothetical protein
MRQTITLILAVYVIVYVCISIYNKPNLEFFYAEEGIVNSPRYVRAVFQNGGIRVNWSHPIPFQNVKHYEIHIKDTKNEFNDIRKRIITEGINSTNPTTLIRDSGIIGDGIYNVYMVAVNNNNKKSENSNNVRVYSSTTESNPTLSGGTVQTIDESSRRFKEQEGQQNIQNKAISEMKKRVDALRNDIVILKNKEKDEYRSVYNKVEMEDSISQLPNSVKDRLGMGLPSEIDFNFTIDPTL